MSNSFYQKKSIVHPLHQINKFYCFRKIILKLLFSKLFLTSSILLFQVSLRAQVTIGSTSQPAKAALLQLKTQNPDADNATTDAGGLLLPKVKLVDRTTMEPFIANDADFQNNVEKIKDKHAGLIVYNLSSSILLLLFF